MGLALEHLIEILELFPTQSRGLSEHCQRHEMGCRQFASLFSSEMNGASRILGETRDQGSSFNRPGLDMDRGYSIVPRSETTRAYASIDDRLKSQDSGPRQQQLASPGAIK